MVTFETFKEIDTEIKSSVEQALSFIKAYNNDHNYILLLADGEYKSEYENSVNPYVIDSREERYRDQDRLDFFIDFMRTHYSFRNGSEPDDNKIRMHLELMIYMHFWESKPVLKKLFRIAALANMKVYPWEVAVPEMSKHNFIRNEIRDILKKRNLHLSVVISKGFHTSLRNAFAHSEYFFDDYNKKIDLYTYKGDWWDLKNISYDNWTKRFIYSALLSYHLLQAIHQKRTSLKADFGKEDFLIIHPITKTRFRTTEITYEEDYDRFTFTKNLR